MVFPADAGRCTVCRRPPSCLPPLQSPELMHISFSTSAETVDEEFKSLWVGDGSDRALCSVVALGTTDISGDLTLSERSWSTSAGRLMVDREVVSWGERGGGGGGGGREGAAEMTSGELWL